MNTLSFAAGIAANEVRIVRGQSNLVMEIIGTGDRIDLGSPATPGMGVSRILFADGTEWNEAALITLARAGTDDNDIINGDDLENALNGAGGDDILIGNGGADSLDGGVGSDRLEGGEGDDTYHFAANGSHDRIFDSGGLDTLVLDAGITPADITVSQSRDGADFALSVKSTGARITIENAFDAGKIETIRFADNTVWTVADLIARAPSFEDDVLTGNADDNEMIGGLGNDHLSGAAGNDTYHFARGDGSDVIFDKATSTADRLVISGYAASVVSFHRLAPDSHDVAIRFAGTTDQILIVNALANNFAGIEAIGISGSPDISVADIRQRILTSLTTAGNDIIIGTTGDDMLAGGKGNDLLRGGAGTDTYVYSSGDGDDRIDPADGVTTDIVRLTDYNVSDIVSAVRAGPDSNDLVITFTGAGDRLVLMNALGPYTGWPDTFVLKFANGTEWNRIDMRNRALADIDGSGDDNVYGFDGADIFAARAGNDLLSGAGGDDLYHFRRGAGHDTVVDTANSATDRILIADFASTDASVEQLYRSSEVYCDPLHRQQHR